jgi:hypothetical protein
MTDYLRFIWPFYILCLAGILLTARKILKLNLSKYVFRGWCFEIFLWGLISAYCLTVVFRSITTTYSESLAVGVDQTFWITDIPLEFMFKNLGGFVISYMAVFLVLLFPVRNWMLFASKVLMFISFWIIFLQTSAFMWI